MMTSVAISAKFQVLQAASFRRVPWLVHGFSTRHGGFSKCYGGRSLNLGCTKEDSREAVEKNRRLFLAGLGATTTNERWPLVTLNQVHSDVIHVMRSRKPLLLIGDGLVTNVPDLALGIQTADCFPVLLVDRANRAVGAFHAGWRGTVQRIVEKGLGTMRREYGTQPEEVSAVVGPGIHKCCYQVGEELRSQFESQFDYGDKLFQEFESPDPIREKYPLLFLSVRPPGHGEAPIKLHLDLAEANRRQLQRAGVPKNHITVLDRCTSCSRGKFFSYRGEKGVTGRMMAVVGIRQIGDCVNW